MFFRSSRFTSISIFLLALIILPFTGKVYAQLDPTFGTNGIVTAALGTEDAMLANFVLPDGKILVAAVAKINGQQKTFFIKYNSDGTPDSAYGPNGTVQLPIPYLNPTRGAIIRAARQPDGKIVIVGYDYLNNIQRALVARFNEDGTLDTTFAGGSGISRPNLSINGDSQFYSVIIQPDGKILIAGGAEFSSSTYPNFCLMRYLSNGSVDTGFGTTGPGFIVHTSITFPSLEGGEFLYLQSNGKIIVGNMEERVNGPADTDAFVRRYNADGTVDSSFTVLNFPGASELQAVFVQPDDKILVGSQVSKTELLERVHNGSRITRYNADGSPDSGFGNAGQISPDIANYQNDFPKGFQVLPDGHILVAYSVSIGPNRSIYRGKWLAIVRISPTGAVNGKFLAASTGDNFVSYITVLTDGKILTSVSGRGWNNADGVKLVRAAGVPLKNYVFHANPFDFPAGSNSTDIAVYRPGDNRFHFYPSIDLNTNPAPGDVIAPADYIGDFACELAYFRPSTGTWYIVRSFWGSGQDVLTVRWGAAGDIPVPGDFNGDGKADPAVFRPSEGIWYIYHIADGSYTILKWGIDGDEPVVGDYDGDGTDDIAVFRPSTGDWWILRSSDGGYSSVHFGMTGDIPVQEDYDGDGKFDIAVYRPSTGIWYRINSSDISFSAFQWGLPGDIPVPGNYDNDQKANVAVWRPANGTWYIVNPDYASMMFYTWGTDGDIPLPAKY